MRIQECPPFSKRKAWLVIERNGTGLGEAAAEPRHPGHRPACCR